MEYLPHWEREKVYICPREIAVHRGKPQLCGKDCETKRKGGKVYEVNTVLKMVVVEKRTEFRPEILLPEDTGDKGAHPEHSAFQ